MTDITDADFQTAVLDRSNHVPVVVDLWAPWCGPCKTLGPMIENVIAETDGAVELVKVNVDENPAVSQAFQVQSIPAVYALKDGKVIDGFVGALPERQIREFVAKLSPTEETKEVERLIEIGDEDSLREALALEPDNAQVIVALADLLVTIGRSEEALELLARIPDSDETRRVAAMARTGAGTGTGDADEVVERLESLLGEVKTDPDARQNFVDLLEVLGTDDPRTSDYRKRLTNALY
ncbi:MAG TPA: thioredoxin [Acidimicrobiales bacterium]|jgi:putative thioredoxin